MARMQCPKCGGIHFEIMRYGNEYESTFEVTCIICLKETKIYNLDYDEGIH